MRVSKKPLVSAVALGTVMLASSSFAQVEEIIITAEMRNTNVQATPLAVTAVSADMLEARNQTNIFQVSAQAPNVTLTPAGVGNGPAMLAFIRGVGQTDFNFAVEPGVGIYVDDVYFPTLTGSLIELLDLDRVEILRGPQGTLAGRNAIGGFIKLYSQKPGEEEGGRVSITSGSFNRLDFSGAADLKFTDSVSARISGVSKTEDGYVDRLDYACATGDKNFPTFLQGGDLTGCKLGTEGGRSVTSLRAAIRWDVSDNVEINLVHDNTNEDSEAPPGVLLQVNEARAKVNGYGAGTSILGVDGKTTYWYDNRFVTHGQYRQPNAPVNDAYVTYSNYIDTLKDPTYNIFPFAGGAIAPIQTLNQQGTSVTVDWTLSDSLAFKSITAVREYESDWAQDADASPINSQQLIQRLEHAQKSQEFRLSGKTFQDKLEYTVGVFWFDQDGTLEANVNLPYAGINFIHGPDPTPSTSKAIFANGVYHITDDLNLSLGLRRSEDKKDYVFFRRNPDGTLPTPCTGFPFAVPVAPNCVFNGLYNQSAHFEGDRTDWRVALDYAFTDSIMGYAQVSTGYKAGGVNPRPYFIIQIEDLAPEEVTAYEVGVKSVLFDRRLRLNGAVFFNDYSDIQLQQNECEQPDGSIGAPCLQPANAGDADVSGIELEAELDLDSWILDASISTLDFEYTRISPSVQVTKNMKTPFTPDLKYSIGAQYTYDMGSNGTLSSRLDLSYQDDIYAAAINAPSNLIEGYSLVNGRVTWSAANKDWQVFGEVNNLTDEEYYLTIFDQYLSSATVTGTIAKPRTFAVGVKRNF
jgi:iron complex outermembrane recepter protein